MIKPKRLQAGGTIGLISPSSQTPHQSSYQRFEQWCEERGFKLKIMPHARESWAYLAGQDETRAADVNAAFADPEIDLVLAMRGGYGGWRTVAHVDFDVIRNNPKPLVGFSDITALHLAIAKEADLVTFYGAVAVSLLKDGKDGYIERAFMAAVTGADPVGVIEPDPDDPFHWTINSGTAEGPLRGGCLSLMNASIGTPWEQKWDGCIVFFEDVGEPPHRLDGYLQHLRLAGKFDNVVGVVVGEHAHCGPGSYRQAYPYGTFDIEEVFRQQLGDLDVPVMVGLPLGHGKRIATLPLGVGARLDADAGRLEIVETATID